MSTRTTKSPPPLVGQGGCLALAIAFLLFAVFQLATAQIVDQPGWFGDVASVLPVIAGTGAIVAMSVLPRLAGAYRALWLSAACLSAWLIVTWLASLGE